MKCVGYAFEENFAYYSSGKMFENLAKAFASGILSCLIMITACASAALASSPVAVLKSARNVVAYQDQHLGTFDDDWLAIGRTLGAANIQYEEISDAEVSFGLQRIGSYKVIIIPQLVDLPASVVSALTEFQRVGGKLVITDAGGTPLAGAQQLEQLAGVTIAGENTTTEKRKIVWSQKGINDEFSIGSVVANFTPASDSTVLARWTDASGRDLGPAVTRKNNATFISWSPALQGEITTNAHVLGSVMDDLAPGIAQQAAVQISFAEFQTIQEELNYLTKRTEESIKTAKQADLAVPFNLIQEKYDSAVKNVNSFVQSYRDRNFFEADEYLGRAREDFAMAFALAMPVRPVEARCVWLDRGTIVSTRNKQGMSALFDRLKASGINVVYFETNNAGFTTFPSRVAQQNPDTLGWDPLGCAVEEAHKRGIELHSWVWIFNVGNARHNPIIGKPADYPGPVLSSHDFAWALQSATGSLIPPKQYEFWIDPSCPEAKNYVKNLISEIIQKYKIDGIQLDYIRYPFNNRGGEMGFNWAGRQRFEKDTGMNLDLLTDETREVWIAWKIQQVNNFVKDVSATIRQLKPGLRISAAVYALPRRWRLSAIQQEWETWVANGWVDTLNPMTYVTSAKDLENNAGYVRESTADKALVYPGLSIRQLDPAGLIEQLDSARVTGTLGTTLFAVAQLDDKKVNILKSGPYRKSPILTPQSEPLKASRLLIDDFCVMVNRYLQDPQKHILSDQASTNEVLVQIDQIQKSMHHLHANSSPAEIEAVCKDVTSLHETIKNWLRLEAFIQRGFRAQYIVSYLGQVEAILSYAAHKGRTGSTPTSVAGADL
ncbi:MAG: hypothetical protein C5B53_00290 [Candidatus Melainabacteria bacterium]|nr:MAG: hypothetical protein C5B53_00290 [Candidatus Melainabacteria bacterium]